MTPERPPLSDAAARQAIATAPRRHAHRRSRGRHREDDRAGRPDRHDPGRRPRRCRRDRRGDLHREGGRRAEAASARAPRPRADRRPRPDPRAAQRLDLALKGLEEAHVSTIHGFCADLLRERPVEARIDPLFEVLTEPASARLFDRRSAGGCSSSLRIRPKACAGRCDAAAFGGDDGPIDRLRRAAWDLAQWRDFTGAWTRPPFDRRREIDAAIDQLHELRRAHPSILRRPDDPLHAGTEPARRLSDEIVLQRSATGQEDDAAADYDGWEAALVDLSRDRTLRQRPRPGAARHTPTASRASACAQARVALKARLDQFRMDADADLAALPADAICAARSTATTRSKPAAARSTSSTCCSARATWCATTPRCGAGSRRRFKRIFVDEFQDTDPLQAEILLLLAADDDGETDWRRARPRAGHAVPRRRSEAVDLPLPPRRRRRLSRGLRSARQRSAPRSVQLTTSFRSVPGNPGVRERGVRAGHDRRRVHAAGALRPARAASRPRSPDSRRSSRCRCRSRTSGATSAPPRSNSRCLPPSARWSTGCCATADGR